MSDHGKHGGQGDHGKHGGQGDHGGQGNGQGGQNSGQGGQGNGQGNGQNGGQGGGQGSRDLAEPVDWMTYSHQQLYDMVHTGVDLNAAGSAQSDWTAVGKALGDVQVLLSKAISQSTQAWTGQTADLAREALVSVESWALNTSDHAENVAKCIGDEIQHVQTAREMMPPPAPAPPIVTPVGAPAGEAAGLAAVATPVAEPRSPLITNRRLTPDTGFEALSPVEPGVPGPVTALRPNPFANIDAVAAPAVDSVLVADATHRQAAEVMALFQQNSYAVDRTVPSFSPPTNPIAPPPPPAVVVPGPSGPPAAPHDGAPVVVNRPQQPPAQRGATAAQAGSRGFGRGGRSAVTGGRGVMPTPVGATGGGGGGGGLGTPGSSTGALGSEPGARSANGGAPGGVTSQFQAPKSVTPQAGVIGPAPMAAPMAPPSSGSNERNRPDYLEDDDNVFGVDRKAAPPVIGL